MPLPGHSEVWTQSLREEVFKESPATSSAIPTSEGQVRLLSLPLASPCDSTSSQASVLQQGVELFWRVTSAGLVCWES